MTKYQHADSCNNCGEHAEIVSGDQFQCKTKCTVCGFDDYWSIGFFHSLEYGLDMAKRYWWDTECNFYSEKYNDKTKVA